MVIAAPRSFAMRPGLYQQVSIPAFSPPLISEVRESPIKSTSSGLTGCLSFSPARLQPLPSPAPREASSIFRKQ